MHIKTIPQNIQKTTLDNGLVVITEYIAHVQTAAIGFWLRQGSRSETQATLGMSHFIEHLLFKGTDTRSSFEIAHSLERFGGNLNAYTAKEMTVYYAHILAEFIPQTIDVLADLITNPLFAEKDLQTEKKVISEEIKSSMDMPDEVCQDTFTEMIYPDNALGWSILGNDKCLSSYSQADVTEFWKTAYQPSNMCVSASGNINHDEIVGQLQKVTFRNQGRSKPDWVPVPAVEHFARTIYGNTSQSHVCMGFRSMDVFSPDRFQLVALSNYLGGGMSSVLFQEIREKLGLAYSIYTFSDFYRDTGDFGIYYACDPEEADKARDKTIAALESVLQKPLNEQQCIDLRNQLKGEFMLGIENLQRRMSYLGKREIYDQEDYSFASVLEQINSVSAEKIIEIATHILKFDEMIQTIVHPANKRKHP
jgi:predicted Zn-dependent peptidase